MPSTIYTYIMIEDERAAAVSADYDRDGQVGMEEQTEDEDEYEQDDIRDNNKNNIMLFIGLALATIICIFIAKVTTGESPKTSTPANKQPNVVHSQAISQNESIRCTKTIATNAIMPGRKLMATAAIVLLIVISATAAHMKCQQVPDVKPVPDVEEVTVVDVEEDNVLPAVKQAFRYIQAAFIFSFFANFAKPAKTISLKDFAMVAILILAVPFLGWFVGGPIGLIAMTMSSLLFWLLLFEQSRAFPMTMVVPLLTTICIPITAYTVNMELAALLAGISYSCLLAIRYFGDFENI